MSFEDSSLIKVCWKLWVWVFIAAFSRQVYAYACVEGGEARASHRLKQSVLRGSKELKLHEGAAWVHLSAWSVSGYGQQQAHL